MVHFEQTAAQKSRPMVIFPAAVIVVALCGVLTALAPEPGRVNAPRWEDPAAEAASRRACLSVLAQVEGAASR